MTCRSGTRSDLNQVFVGYLVKMHVTSNKQRLCVARAKAIRWSELVRRPFCTDDPHLRSHVGSMVQATHHR